MGLRPTITRMSRPVRNSAYLAGINGSLCYLLSGRRVVLSVGVGAASAVIGRVMLGIERNRLPRDSETPR